MHTAHLVLQRHGGRDPQGQRGTLDAVAGYVQHKCPVLLELPSGGIRVVIGPAASVGWAGEVSEGFGEARIADVDFCKAPYVYIYIYIYI